MIEPGARVFLAGSMAGDPCRTAEAFVDAEIQLQALGMQVRMPSGDAGADVDAVMTADAVVVLPGSGVLMETVVADIFDVPVFPLATVVDDVA